MSLTLAEATAHITHAIGGPLVGIQNERILDEAGRTLLSARAWNFAKRPSATLTLVVSQAYVALPADFGSIVTLEYASGTWNRVMQTTTTEIARMRSTSVGWPNGVYVAPNFAADADGIPVPRLELYRTPTAVDTLTLNYRVKWPDLSVADENFIPVPDYAERLYVELVRAVAYGYQQDDAGARIAFVLGGAVYQNCVRMDESIQPVFGPLQGGMTERDRCYQDNYLRTAAAAPSL